MTTIAASSLTKRYGSVTAVDDLTFAVERGVVGLLGPNGAGKSTTLRALLGLVRPMSGHAELLGVPGDRPSGWAGRVGALVEEPALYPDLTGAANLAVHARLGGHARSRRDEVLELLGLTDRAGDRVGGYSRGMRQRLGVAIALLPDPEVLLLDEPTNGLDPRGAVAVRTLLRRLGDGGTTVLVSSHLLAEVEAVCDRVLVLDRGRLIFDGTVDEARAAHQAVIIVAPELDDDRDRLVGVLRERGYDVMIEDRTAHVRADAAAAPELNRVAAAAGVTLRRLEPRSGSLEDAFLALTRRPEVDGP